MFGKNSTTRDGMQCECRPCRATRRREYYGKNRDRILSDGREYRARNRADVLLRKRDYNARTRAHRSAYAVAKYAAGGDAARARNAAAARTYRIRNREKLLVRWRSERTKNRDKLIARERERSAELHDGYVRHLLCRVAVDGNVLRIPASAIPRQLIEAKREHLQLLRQLKGR